VNPSYVVPLRVFSTRDWSVSSTASLSPSVGSCSPAVFSPDSSRAYFTCGSSLYALPTSGGAQAPTLVTSALTSALNVPTGGSSQVTFTPDGTRLVYLVSEAGGVSVHSAPLSGAPAVAVAPAAARVFWIAPDSSRVLALDGDRLVSGPVAGGSATTLGAGVTSTTFSPDQRTVAFLSNGSLLVVPAAGTTPIALASNVSRFEFAPGGAHLLVTGTDGVLWRAALGGGLVQIAANVTAFEYTPAGTHVLARTAGGSLWLAPLAGGSPQVIAPLVMSWSYTPDRSRIVLVAGDGRLQIVSTSGGTVTTLAEDAEPYSLSFSPDGSRILFRSAGLVSTVPTMGGPVTSYLRGSSWATWIDAAHVVMTRSSGEPPYRFQEGYYLAAVP
jgi:hypothetical protein